MEDLSRRKFIKRVTAASVAINGMFLLESFGFEPGDDIKIYLPKDSELAVHTAAEVLAKKIKAAIILEPHTGAIQAGEIVFVVGDKVKSYTEASSLIEGKDLTKEWELVKKTDKGFIFAAGTSRNLCRVALSWIEFPESEVNRFSNYRFEKRYTMWDNSLNQWFRFSKGFDREQHVYDLARLGFTGMEINRYADPGGFHVINRKFKDDPYPWYMSYAPALDAFVDSSYTKGIYPQDEVKANLDDLKKAVALSRKYGLKLGFVCYEPRGVSEKVFDRYPELRGARIDHPGRSLEPRYSLDIANPKVLDHYAQSITNLMQVVPDLSYFAFWTQDSGSGMPFSKGLYAGPNGSYLSRSKKMGEMAGNFMKAILDAGRKINPEFEVIMKLDWEYFEDERKEIAKYVPEGATLVHVIGSESIKGGGISEKEMKYIHDGRKEGLEPYADIMISSSWETEPIIGLTRPAILQKKVEELVDVNITKLFAQGGIFSKSICPYNVTQELFSELLRNKVPDLNQFLYKTAKIWCNNDEKPTKSLVKAWQVADEVFELWPVLNWYDSGAGTTQGRWLTRPLVPDVTLLKDNETVAWKRELFPVPWDVARKNIAFEGGIRMYTEEQLDGAVKAYDKMIPKLKEVIKILKKELKSGPAVIVDQHDRYLGFLYRCITTRNLYAAQLAINNILMEKGSAKENQKSLDDAMHSEIKNTENWIELLETSTVYFFRVTDNDETPFQYKTPVADFKLKLEVMKNHLKDKPGPYLEELFLKGSEKELLFYN